MDEVTYSIYCLYTVDNDIYIGLSKNPRLRIDQHFRKSCNFRLRELIENGSKEIFSEILHSGLTQQEASQLEKVLIKKYKQDPEYRILNVQSGGIRGNAKIEKSPKISKPNTKVLSDNDIVLLREKYSKFKKHIKFAKECKQYNLTKSYFTKILRGMARHNVGGPLLGKDYTNG
jgi:predicted GIY-YIG superfamily endonuclease